MYLKRNKAYKKAVLTAAALAGTLLLDAKLRLFKNNVVVDQNTDPATLTAANYTGYAEEALTWHTVSVSDDGKPEAVSDPVIFRPTDAVTPNTIYGAQLYDDSGTPVFLGAGNFDSPVPMNSAEDELMLVVRVREGEDPEIVVVS